MTYALTSDDTYLSELPTHIEGLTERGNTFRVEIVQMTPERAERLLDQNTRNRSVKVNREKNYAGQMKAGQWYVDGSPIRVDRDGVLLDGQHRLYAIIESGTTQTVVLITGLESQSMNSIDTGVSRTLGDLLKLTIPDVKNESAAGALSRGLYYRSLNAPLDECVAISGHTIAADPRLTNAAIIDHYARNRVIVDRLMKSSESVRRSHPKWKGFSARTIALVRAELEAIDFDEAQFFFDRIKDGAGLDVKSPIMALIRFGERTVKDPHRSPSGVVWAGMLIKAWNAFRNDRPVHNLSFRASGPTAEAFPEPF